MDGSTLLGLASVIVLVFANGFFVAAEFAMVAVRRSRIEELARVKRPGAESALTAIQHLDSSIAACQLGITMASLALGWIGEPVLAHLIEPPLERIVGSFAPTYAHIIAIGISFAIITALHIVLGELAPKGLALQRAEATVLVIARPLNLFARIFQWPIWILNAIGNAVLRLAGLKPADGHELPHSAEELQLLVNTSSKAQSIEPAEAVIASRALEFHDRTAEDLMTPRVDLEAIPVDIAWSDLVDRITAGTHSRIVVYDESLDHIVGYLHVHDLFAHVRHPDTFNLAEHTRPVHSVPPTKPADDLLIELQQMRQHLAVVIDEYGGTAGVVTVENLVEALIKSATTDGSRTLSGQTRIHEFTELTGWEPHGQVEKEIETIGGLIMEKLARIPRVNDSVTIGSHILTVIAMDGHRVARVRLRPAAADEAAQAALDESAESGGDLRSVPLFERDLTTPQDRL